MNIALLSTKDRSAARRAGAFTLMELIIVVALLVIISALVVPAVSGFGRSAALTTAGNTVVNLATLARQSAISKNTLSALVLLGRQGNEQDYRALTVLEYDPQAGWTQIGNWEQLPTGVVVDFSDTTSCTFLENSPQPFPFLTRGPKQNNPPVTYQGAQVTDGAGYAARIFLPNGALQNPEKAAQIRLVEGFAQAGKVVYTRRDEAGKTANYYDVAILGMTGATKISRP